MIRYRADGGGADEHPSDYAAEAGGQDDQPASGIYCFFKVESAGMSNACITDLVAVRPPLVGVFFFPRPPNSHNTSAYTTDGLIRGNSHTARKQAPIFGGTEGSHARQQQRDR